MSIRRSLTFSLSFLFVLSLHAQQTSPATPPAAGPQAAAGPNGQAPSQPTAENTLTRTTRLVVLDAVVVDRKGAPVTDLTRDEFRVTDNDLPQELRFFDAPGKYTPDPSLTINSTADLDRLAPRTPVNVIVLDEFNTLFEDMAFARYSLKKLLEKQPGKLSTPTMLVGVSLTKFEVIHDYTQDRDAILTALDHHFSGYPWQAAGGQWRGERKALALLTLARVSEATIGHNGHKNMIWIGRGFPTTSHLTDSDEQNAVHTAVVRIVNELRDARVTLYTIDPAGVQTDPYKYGEAAGLFAPFGGDPDFQQIATETGGRNLFGRNDVDAEIGTAVRDGASLYALVYRPSADTRGAHNDFHSIKVTTTRPGLTVITRQGYFPDRRPVQLRDDGTMGNKLKQELLGAESGNMAYDAVSFSVKPKADEPNTYILTLDGAALPWRTYDTGGLLMKAILLETTFDKKGKELHRDGQEVSAKPPADYVEGTRITKNLALPVKLNPDPKAVRARFVVRLSATGRIGTADYPLDGSATEVRSRATAEVPAATAAPVTPAPATPQP